MQNKESDLEIVKSYYLSSKDSIHYNNNNNNNSNQTATHNQLFSGVPENYKEVKTLGQLLETSYRYTPTKLQLRENLSRKIKQGENPFSSIIGFDGTVIPAIKRAILAAHDILLIGHIGQGKTKIAELVSRNLLSPIPIVDGTITNDIPTEMPYTHLASLLQDKEIARTIPEFFVSKDCEEIIKNNKLDTKIRWVDGRERYRYVLATPDISVKDLVGQIDVVRVIKKGIEIFDIDSYSPGYLLQARYGILCLDELPVLDPRKQVTLLSVLQEGRFTTGAYPVFFKPDVKIIATANPVDYTHSGKIIEPLSDRLKSHIETHYPGTLDDEILISIQEMDMLERKQTFVPIFILKTIVKVFQALRGDPEINSERGVSVRSTIHSLETIIGEAESKRTISHNSITVPRFSDIYCIFQSSKFELDDIEDTTENRMKFLFNIIDEVIKETSREYFNGFINSKELLSIKNEFKDKTFRIMQNQYQSMQFATNNQQHAHGGKQTRKEQSNQDDNNHYDNPLYNEQLKQFPATKSIVKKIIDKIKDEQDEYIEKARNFHISNNLEYLNHNNSSIKDFEEQEEVIASVMELLLEYLRFSNPPLLDRKEDKFMLA
ncbi:MAG: AAA family ATPase [Thermoproteota archaeon]|nr:AAA family ATPase [Thermoproteota archaeon]